MIHPTRVMGDMPRDPKEIREPLQCWGFGGPYLRRNCPHRNGNVIQDHDIQEEEIVGQVERTIPRIYTALKDHQEDHHSSVVEVAGKIIEQFVSVLIEPGSTQIYITPRIVEICAFKKLKHRKSW